ncbi:MAG TPA: TatD family hydrolase, partial [Anaeromyxobacteraceae bacterium]|nr:TatD family hydrolase [Anaeromyxobacteraceae bacterium]
MARLVDSHAHLDRREYAADLDAVVGRARDAGVGRIVVVGLWRGPGDFGDALELVDRDPATFAAAIGIHPHECVQVPEEDWALSERLARDPRVVAVGETGLDFHYDYSPRDVQIASFRRSIRIAREAGKPVVVHVREADDACADVLEAEGVPPAGGVIHCFTGDWPRARRYLDLGLYISVAGVVTFKAADDLRDAIRQVPRERLLVETDCPFLAPVPFRGKRNEPAHVARTAETVASLWGVTLDE